MATGSVVNRLTGSEGLLGVLRGEEFICGEGFGGRFAKGFFLEVWIEFGWAEVVDN